VALERDALDDAGGAGDAAAGVAENVELSVGVASEAEEEQGQVAVRGLGVGEDGDAVRDGPGLVDDEEASASLVLVGVARVVAEELAAGELGNAAAVQRATRMCSRLSCVQTLSAP
jgi:hypothetical protein